MTTNENDQEQLSKVRAAVAASFYKRVADFTDAYERLAESALDVLWDEENNNLFRKMRGWYHQKNALRESAHKVCETFDWKTFGHFLFVCLDDICYHSIRYSNEDLMAAHEIRVLLNESRVLALRLLELMEDAPVTQVWSAFVHFPRSTLPYFEEEAAKAKLIWRETQIRYETPWFVEVEQEEKEGDPFVFLEVTGTTHSLGTFVVESLLSVTWCSGYDEITTPTDVAMKEFHNFFEGLAP